MWVYALEWLLQMFKLTKGVIGTGLGEIYGGFFVPKDTKSESGPPKAPHTCNLS